MKVSVSFHQIQIHISNVFAGISWVNNVLRERKVIKQQSLIGQVRRPISMFVLFNSVLFYQKLIDKCAVHWLMSPFGCHLLISFVWIYSVYVKITCVCMQYRLRCIIWTSYIQIKADFLFSFTASNWHRIDYHFEY